MDLEPFGRINPCGYDNLEVTDLRKLGVEASRDRLTEQFQAALVANLGLDQEAIVSDD